MSSGVHVVGVAVLGLVLAVAVSFMAKIVFSLIKTNQIIAKMIKLPNHRLPGKLKLLCDRYQLSNRQVVVVNVSSPCALNFGIFSPKLLVSTGLIRALTDKQLESVLLHELFHLRRRHVPLLLAGEIIAATVFFFPIIKTLIRRMRVVCEQKADAFAVRQQGNSAYLRSALVKVASNPNYLLYPGFAVFDTRSRLDYLLDRRPSSYKISPLTTFVSIFTLVVGIGLNFLPAENHTLAVTGEAVDCSVDQCSTYCLREDPSFTLASHKFTPMRFTSVDTD
jgi:beta-lactamase regulating signal transducer with metallopeptidase domain